MRITDLTPPQLKRGDKVRVPLSGGAVAFLLRDVAFGLVVVPHIHAARRLQGDLSFFDIGATLLPEPQLEGEDSSLLRRGALWSEWKNTQGLLISTPQSLCVPLQLTEGALNLSVGQSIGRNELLGWLESSGYQRHSSVFDGGQYAYRGSVVDLYDPTAKYPLRVEFFDEEIESLRNFYPRTQRTAASLTTALVAPCRGGQSAGCPIDDLPRESMLFCLDPQSCQNNFYGFATLWDQFHPREPLAEGGWDEVMSKFSFLDRLRLTEEDGIDSGFFLPPFFKSDIEGARRWVKTQKEAGFQVFLAAKGLDATLLGADGGKEGTLSGGFVSREDRRIWLSDAELFGLSSVQLDDQGEVSEHFAQSLREGDWVIHDRYGLCQYLGMGSDSFGGDKVETVTLLFAGDKKLIIPVADLSSLTLWDGDGEPVADTLGGKRWKAARAKAQEQIEQEANDLITISARRVLTPGYAFPKGGELLSLYESTFPYRETRDQLKALKEIGEDMSRPFPMDRLLVGDVGVGKTEVALRAAVRAMEAGKQVAFVVPTTVLAQQHYQTALARMAPLPFRLAQLSRMVTASKTKAIKAALAEGTVDMVIGTHALFRGELTFADLGLLIIDEEHRFGVAHKEALKKAYPAVDVLSLSATPIPRTLSMGLRGLKDISHIMTAPSSRGQVFTATGPWDESLVRTALNREFARGGQAYYLHNRVEDIAQLGWQLQGWFPDKKVAVAHGQMAQRQLESVMEQFSSGTIDLLVCTTIVESGLDVGRANTLIVDDARLLGLAQMHQIRGRIGRRDENGYAYFLYPCSEKDLPLASRERIEALGAVSDDNGGYRLAVRDLEIRGAGQVLGTNQSGFKNRIGYGLYYRMLRAKIDELQGHKPLEFEVQTTLSLGIDEDYLTDAAERVGLYRYLAQGLSFEAAEELRASLKDRAGPLPVALDAAISLAILRREGANFGLTKVYVSRGSIELLAPESTSTPRGFLRQGDKLIGAGDATGLFAVEEWLRKEKEHERKL